jgi:hypothetical protein
MCIAYHSAAASSFEKRRYVAVVGGRLPESKLYQKEKQARCPIFILDVHALEWLPIDLLPSESVPGVNLLQSVLVPLDCTRNQFGEEAMSFVFYGGFSNSRSSESGAVSDVHVLSVKIVVEDAGKRAIAQWEKPKFSSSIGSEFAVWGHRAALQKVTGDIPLMRMVSEHLMEHIFLSIVRIL